MSAEQKPGPIYIPEVYLSHNYPQVCDYIQTIFSICNVAINQAEINKLYYINEAKMVGTFFKIAEKVFPPSSNLGMLVQLLACEETYNIKTTKRNLVPTISKRILERDENMVINIQKAEKILAIKVFGDKYEFYLTRLKSTFWYHRKSEHNPDHIRDATARLEGKKKLKELVTELVEEFPIDTLTTFST